MRPPVSSHHTALWISDSTRHSMCNLFFVIKPVTSVILELASLSLFMSHLLQFQIARLYLNLSFPLMSLASLLLLMIEYDHFEPEQCEQEGLASHLCDAPRQAVVVVVSDQGGAGRGVLHVYIAGRVELINKSRIRIIYIFRLHILQRLSVKTTLFCFSIFIYFLLGPEDRRCPLVCAWLLGSWLH